MMSIPFLQTIRFSTFSAIATAIATGTAAH